MSEQSTQPARILVAEDEANLRLVLQKELQRMGHDVRVAPDGEAALRLLEESATDVLLCDINMPRMDGLELLRRLHQRPNPPEVIMLTGVASVETAIEAMKLGAYDYLSKPYRITELDALVKQAAEKRRLRVDNQRLRALAERQTATPEIVFVSDAMREVMRLVERVAPSDASALITGESGTGKELIANAIHRLSNRSGGSFIDLNCAAIQESLLESELFGHEAGAFTGAVRARAGKLQHASGGTLFLDEIDSMPLGTQGKLLRALQERMVERLGSNQSIAVDLRAIAASKVDLRRASQDGRFRLDLYYRLSVVELTIPPLRERKEDIPLLFEFFAAAAAQAHGREFRRVPAATLGALTAQDWPGNVRELRNAAERYALGLAAVRAAPAEETPRSLAEQVEAFERAIIERSLAETGGRISVVMERLAIPRRTLSEKMARFGLERRAFRDGDRQNPANGEAPNGGNLPRRG